MPATPFCSFCTASGIKGPHDHFVRASKAPGSAVTCPKLKVTTCNYCNKLGHTAKFCGEAADARRMAAAAMLQQNKAKMAAGEWMDVRVRAIKDKPINTDIIGKIINDPPKRRTFGFAMLECESSDSEEIESTTQEVEASDFLTAAAGDLAGSDGKSWAAVVKESRAAPLENLRKPPGISWADWEEEDA